MRALLSRSPKDASASASPSAAQHVPAINVHEPPDGSTGPNPPPPTARGGSSSGGGGGGMAAAFVSKSRRVKFELHLRILDLNNVPLVSGTSSVKWHLPASTAAEHRGRTAKCAIREHRVAYDYDKRLPVRLTVGRQGLLQECPIELEVLQEYSAAGRGERIVLGNVRLNLAEYVDVGADPSSPGAGPTRDDGVEETGGVVRRYLMQDSKINSTLKLGIHMRYVEGTRDYSAPPLRTAPVFGGIAGIISSSEPAAPPSGGQLGHNNNNAEEAGAQEPLPNLSTRNKELGEMQDMYRRTLAAFWASQPGELKADECIEDIFAGGDGWGSKIYGVPSSNKRTNDNTHSTKDDGATTHSTNPLASSPTFRRSRSTREHSSAPPTNGSNSGASTPRAADADGPATSAEVAVTGRGEGRMHAQGKGMLAMGRKGRHSKNFPSARRGQGEVDEFEVQEDLRSWRVGIGDAVDG